MKRWNRDLRGHLAVLLTSALFLASCSQGDAEDHKLYPVGGTVAGLVGTIVLQNRGTDDLPLSQNGSFTFPTSIKVGLTYDVSVATQPPGQVCNVVHGTGMVTGAVADVVVTCFDNPGHSLGGTVSGLAGTVVLRNGTENLSVGANGTFAFVYHVSEGAAYSVSVLTQPSGQLCSVANGSGVMPAADVNNVTVTCVNNPSPVTTYSIGGTVSGLDAGKSLQLGLQHSGSLGNTIDVTSNGTFSFDPDKVAAGETYVVSIATQPTGQACSVSNGSGTMPASDVANVAVNCVDDPSPVVTYSIGGTVSGLDPGKTLQLSLQHAGNVGNTIDVTSNGPFNFDPVRVAAGETYVVSIAMQPTGQACSVSNGSGTANSNVTNVAVSCEDSTTTYSVGGTIAGLAGSGLRIENGSGNAVAPGSGESTFSLPEEFANGAAYDVGIAAQPAGQTCLITRSQGVITGADVTNIRVACIDNVTSPLSGTYTVPALSEADIKFVYLTLFPDGVFVYANIENPKGCGHRGDGNGVEYGAYDYDAATGAFSITAVVVDTNGRCGVWADGRSRVDGTLTVSGSGQDKVLALDVTGGDALEFRPVFSAAGQIYGSFADVYRRNFWLFLGADANNVYFLNTETQADPNAGPTTRVAGLEYACGALNGTASSGTMSRDFSSATCLTPVDGGPVDTNGTAGLSHFVGSWEFSVNGDALTSSTFSGMRVVPD